ncbi:unnamed protein product [Coffea canephora]|uniref:DH200=94 genomic scaffold, scaffold_174 n=2 Tax=Coffea TaxID=13442 RepID=A0A068VAZ1_COFCA|nr:F-box/kelch-repeat protein SKIP25-like [Coffea arabica]CDP17709.1 unnamed protein product [Coffea canephora]
MSKSIFTTTSRSSSFTINSVAKRPKHHHHHHHQTPQKQEQEQEELPETSEDQSLLPGLPDHIAQLCLSKVQPSLLYSVCWPWRRLIYSPSFPPFLSIYALLIPSETTPDHQSHDSIKFSCFDPISSNWLSLPSPPPDPLLCLLLRHPSFISRRLPIQSVTVSGKLVLLAATADQFQPALNSPLIFNPLSKTWTYGPPIAAPRRWCAAGASAGVVYMASGVGSHYNLDVARSVEKWDLLMNQNNSSINIKRDSQTANWRWEKMGGLRDGRFSRDAIDAVGWKGKLCMVNVKGDAAKEGIIYDMKNDAWEEMPEGMLAGWRGPAAAMDEEIIYMVNESKGVLRMYDPLKDAWVQILESKMLQDAQYVAAAGGRVCIVGGSGLEIVVVDVVVSPPRFWVVDTPPAYQAVAIHVLPRMGH